MRRKNRTPPGATLAGEEAPAAAVKTFISSLQTVQ